MASSHRQNQSSGRGRARASAHAVFTVLAAALIAVVTVSVGSAARSDKWWWDNLAGPDSSNFVGADQVTKANVSRLEVAWFYPYATSGFNPIAVDNVIYTAARGNALVALDATTGKEIWVHDNLGGAARGINYWQSDNGKDKRLIFWINSFMQEIDAATGKSITSFGTNGYVDLREGLARAENTGATVASRSPGKVWKNLIILGSAPGEAWISPPGDIRAYDVVTGKRVWQFHTVPLPGEFGYETWPKDAYKYVGGANNWGSMAVDDERGIVYIPTGSPTYDFYGADRRGTNLFGNCLLALDARTGKRLWHFQTVHHDLWDLDNVSAPQLVTVRHNGRRVDAVAHAGKTGFLYVFDRVTGEPLWPIEERPVPQTDVPGEYSHPTQPFPTKPAPFGKQSFTVDDVNPWLVTPEQYEDVKQRVAKARNGTGPQGGLFIPPAVDQETVSMPGNQGGSNWGTTAADPEKGMVFVVNVNQVALLKLVDVRTYTGRGGGAGALIATGAAVFQQNCAVCHGTDLNGAMPGVPSLVGVSNRMAEDAIKAIITGGKGLMRPFPDLSPSDLDAVTAFVSNPTGRGGGAGFGRGRGGAAPSLPPGPVVASGGVPLPALPPRGGGGPRFGGAGPTGGDAAYPGDVENAPTVRYASGYNVMAQYTKPPYTTLTAYDLNTGEIKWQVPNGDHPPTIARGGPTNTGGVAARNGVVVTKGGLVFHAGGDGKIRAYDEQTGGVLWTGTFTGSTSGVPVGYEAKGRQYFALIASQGGGRGGGGGARGGAPAPPVDPNTPTGLIAYALPVRK
ncbi:MAG: PQQ-binding-like beta-propeller repeat protein [Acidobacteria bacterium]|nr:PQQ-binding-like beta-propeller repeat protein [Acidobacteriota bacterium]